jgi:outer membrane protein assembly factor BamD (BamD/ComL family)
MQRNTSAFYILSLCSTVSISGCSFFRPDVDKSPEYMSARNEIESYEDEDGNYVRPEGLKADKKRNSKSVFKSPNLPFIGNKNEDRTRAKVEYAKADELFQQASSSQDSERKKLFEKAAKQYKEAAKYWPSSALEQDAWLMAGESYFFAEQYPESEDMYVKLFGNYPRTKFEDLINKRRMQIGLYWIRHDLASHKPFYVLNLMDDRRPWNDTGGHGRRVLEKMRVDSPTNALSDDATMELASNAFEKGNFEEAAQLYEDLRMTYPDSPHIFDAHFLGLKSVMQTYQGHEYDGQALDKSEKLLGQIGRQFPDKARAQEEYLTRIAAEIDYLRAERLMAAATYRMNRGENRAAAGYLRDIAEKHDRTPFAEKAESELARIGELPPDPEKHLQWLANLVPHNDPVSQLKQQANPITLPSDLPSEPTLQDVPSQTRIAEQPDATGAY